MAAAGSKRLWPPPLQLALIVAAAMACLAPRTAGALQLLGAAPAASAAASCPFHYERHTLDQIRSGAKRPYLFGGIYERGRPCPNCNRGGLWSNFCGFSRLEKVPYWHLQVCNASTIDAIVADALKQDNAADVLTMTPCDLWPFLRGRTTWIVGDSMSKDLYKALKCFMVEFSDLKTYHASSNYSAMHLLHHIPGYGEPHCTHLPDNTRICQIHTIEGDLFVEGNRTGFGGVLPLIQAHLALRDDLFVVNFGLWHGETRQEAYKTYLRQLAAFYARQRSKFPHMFFMETPKQHFDSEDGDFKVPWLGVRKGPWTCQPIKGVALAPDGSLRADPDSAVAKFVAGGSWRNAYAREILGGDGGKGGGKGGAKGRSAPGMPFVSIYNVTVPAWRFHRSNLAGQECSHFCHPSLPQLWVHALLTALRAEALPAVAEPARARNKAAGCAHVYERDETKFGAPMPTERVLDDAERQRSFWAWLFGRSTYVLKDGVLLPTASVAAAGASGGGGGGHAQTLTPWEGLQRLLENQQQQMDQQQQQQRHEEQLRRHKRQHHVQQQQQQDGAPQQVKQERGSRQQGQQQKGRQQDAKPRGGRRRR